MDTTCVKVLVVDDDEEEFTVVRKYLKKARTGDFDLCWVSTFEEALAAVEGGCHDVCLLDYDLGERTGIELLREMRSLGHDLPVILLTGRASFELDVEAMEMGAFDFLEKGDLTPVVLERSIRYTIENHRARVQLRKANEELELRVRERTEALNRSNRDLEQFAHVVAHDLREPLEAMTRHIEDVRSQLAEDEEAERPALGHRILGPVLQDVRNMTLLVESVLDYSRVGTEARPLEVVNLSGVVKEVCTDFQDALSDADATVDVGPMPSVRASYSLVRGLFENLLDNAIKFRGEEPLEIRVWSERRGDTWLCAVSDNGIGIDDQDLDDIFLMFHRGAAAAHLPGIGMGLAMCRKVIQYHGGRIWADSEPGRGATFTFTFSAE